MTVAAGAGGCRPASQDDGSADAAPVVDSLVLERTRCFGACPAYRLSIARSGRVAFTLRNPGDSLHVVDSIPPAAFARLAAGAEGAGLYALPPVVLGDSALCPRARTDAPTVITTSYAGARVTRVDRYTGCAARDREGTPGRLAALARYEDEIDSVAGSSRWVRPATRR
jgi:hypothetical protein